MKGKIITMLEDERENRIDLTIKVVVPTGVRLFEGEPYYPKLLPMESEAEITFVAHLFKEEKVLQMEGSCVYINALDTAWSFEEIPEPLAEIVSSFLEARSRLAKALREEIVRDMAKHGDPDFKDIPLV